MRLLRADSKVLGVISTAAGLKFSLLGYRHLSLQFLAKLSQVKGVRRDKECVPCQRERWERLKLARTAWECIISLNILPHQKRAQSVLPPCGAQLAAPRLTGTLAPRILSCFGDEDSDRQTELGGFCHFSPSRLFNQFTSMPCSGPAESSLYEK